MVSLIYEGHILGGTERCDGSLDTARRSVDELGLIDARFKNG